MNAEPAAPRSAKTKERILEAARRSFVQYGYDRSTIRGIAAEASIDASMVMRYFGSKEQLFTAAAEFDVQTPDLAQVPREQLGAALALHFLERWDADDTLMALLRRAATDPAAADRMGEVFAGQIVPAIQEILGDPSEAPKRAGLVSSQVLGVALCRYVLRFPPVAAMTNAEIARWLGPTLQRYLTAPDPTSSITA